MRLFAYRTRKQAFFIVISSTRLVLWHGGTESPDRSVPAATFPAFGMRILVAIDAVDKRDGIAPFLYAASMNLGRACSALTVKLPRRDEWTGGGAIKI
jgi:hypothetical protein